MSVVKLSYEHLPSNLKHGFAYCSLFPKDYRFMKHELINLWISQGYIEPNNEETDFMHLLRRGFFQEVILDDLGEVKSCKMHNMMHDLALYVAGEESIAMSGTTSQNTRSFTRLISVENCERVVPLLKVKRLRSFLLMGDNSVCSQKTLDKLCQNFKMLRTLRLEGMGMEQKLPSSIGELKLMKYLDLSSNYFKELPNSITNLVNLVALNLRGCLLLKSLPEKFRKMSNLRYLNNEQCDRLQKMPIRIGELTRLQYLSEFIVGKGSGLDALAEFLQQLRGKLLIRFTDDIEDEDECNWKLPVWLQHLEIKRYQGVRIPDWSTINGIERTNNLAHLRLDCCQKVKHLPPLRCLPNIRWLQLEGLWELEFLEEQDHSTLSPFFPRLHKLILKCLPNLKRCLKTTIIPNPQFPLLSDLSIADCSELGLTSFPLCPRLQVLRLINVDDDDDVMQPHLPSSLFCPSFSPSSLEKVTISGCKWLSSLQDEATTSLQLLEIQKCCSLKSLHLASPDLRRVEIVDCDELVSVEVVSSSLRTLTIRGCKQLRNLIVQTDAPVNALEEFEIIGCPELDLRKVELDWYSLPNLRLLQLFPIPPPENLPLSLRGYCQALAQLEITEMPLWSMVDPE